MIIGNADMIKQFILSTYHVQRTLTNQGSKGIRQLPVNWCTSPIMKENITPSIYYNWWLKRLFTQLNEPTNKNSIKVLKVSQRIRKRYYKTLETNSPMSPPFLHTNTHSQTSTQTQTNTHTRARTHKMQNTDRCVRHENNL